MYFYHSFSFMKKIFWTTLFWFLMIFLFRSYMRVFNTPLGVKIGSRFGIPQQVCLMSNINTGFTEQLDVIKIQLDVINQKLQSEPESSTQTAPIQNPVFHTTASTKVALYYFNQIEDQKLAPEQQVNLSSLLPVYRIFPASANLLVDVINELIKWNLTPNEKKQWFITEFPNEGFRLLASDLSPDGTLTLQFSEVPGFTDGWSARMLILSNLIKKTALQFPEVKNVIFVPETLFQP